MMNSFGPDFSLWDSEMKDALESEHGAINEFADNIESFADYLEIGLDLFMKAGLDEAKDVKEPITDEEITDDETTTEHGESTAASLDTESGSGGD
jgi:3-keto-L-gulonate-6-phosphate decarboxylase